ncbi:hypothetical protein GCM10022215_44080 [Nocardioides fonticola]|uniref:Uncharacterized protein n=1 Tax=Nocardioides fonticola TaxID=450363 RepID=A0ABP7Y4U1_9ACTN
MGVTFEPSTVIAMVTASELPVSEPVSEPEAVGELDELDELGVLDELVDPEEPEAVLSESSPQAAAVKSSGTRTAAASRRMVGPVLRRDGGRGRLRRRGRRDRPRLPPDL